MNLDEIFSNMHKQVLFKVGDLVFSKTYFIGKSQYDFIIYNVCDTENLHKITNIRNQVRENIVNLNEDNGIIRRNRI